MRLNASNGLISIVRKSNYWLFTKTISNALSRPYPFKFLILEYFVPNVHDVKD